MGHEKFPTVRISSATRWNDFTVPRFRKPLLYRRWQLIYIDFECNFTDGFGCKFFPQKQPILQTLSICKVTAKAICKITFKVYVNKLSLSITLLGEGFRNGRGCVWNLTPGPSSVPVPLLPQMWVRRWRQQPYIFPKCPNRPMKFRKNLIRRRGTGFIPT